MRKMFDVGSREELLDLSPGISGQSDWITVDQEMIDKFADATGDHQWIHVDTERAARELPGGSTIAHGFLTLSLTPRLLQGMWTLRNERNSLNYGADRLRFIAPVPNGSRVRMNASFQTAELRSDGGVKVLLDCRIEIEGQEAPAVALMLLAVFYLDE